HVLVPDHRGGRLEEQQRLLGYLVAEFRGVLDVVAPDAHHLAGQDRGQQPHVGRGPALAGEAQLPERVALDLGHGEPVEPGVGLPFHGAEGHAVGVNKPSDTHPANLPAQSRAWSRVPSSTGARAVPRTSAGSTGCSRTTWSGAAPVPATRSRTSCSPTTRTGRRSCAAGTRARACCCPAPVRRNSARSTWTRRAVRGWTWPPYCAAAASPPAGSVPCWRAPPLAARSSAASACTSGPWSTG